MSDAAVAATAAAVPPPANTARSAWRSPSGFGFRDLLDIVNPLQHLPVITSIYRWITGDRPGEAADLAGDALYGGPIGVAFGLVGAATEDKAGHDLGERVLTDLFGPGKDTPKDTPKVAAATPGTAPAGPGAIADHPPMPLFGRAIPAAARLAVPDHPPMPLYRTRRPARPVAAPATTASTAIAPDAAGTFIAHNAMLERQIGAGVHAGPPSALVPLVLPPGTLSPRSLRASGAGLVPAPAGPAAPAIATPDQPVNIPQKMLDALDKYRRLEEERKAAPSPGVDLAL